MKPLELVPHFTRNFRNPAVLYSAAKEIDNYPGEGSFNLAILRAIKYYWLPLRQFSYEPLTARSELQDVAHVKLALVDAGTPEHMLDNVMLSFYCFESIRKAP
jgi:hypothetical protein